MVLRLRLEGRMRSGKNLMMVNPKTGVHYPRPEFKKWRIEMEYQILKQLPPFGFTRENPCSAAIVYYPGDKIRRDAPGIIDALWHILERMKVVSDDYLIQEVSYIQMGVDKEHPHCEITIADI